MRPREVNWKNVGDNYSDKPAHPVAHDGLSRLVGKSYRIEAHGRAGCLVTWCRPTARTSGSGSIAPACRALPICHRRRMAAGSTWLWPNMAFDIYAGECQIDFMQWLPVS